MNTVSGVRLIDELNCEAGFLGAQAFLGINGVTSIDRLQMARSLYGVVALSLNCFENFLKPWCREGQSSPWPNRDGSHVDGLLDVLSK